MKSKREKKSEQQKLLYMLRASIVIEIVRSEENECELKAPFSIWNLFTQIQP